MRARRQLWSWLAVSALLLAPGASGQELPSEAPVPNAGQTADAASEVASELEPAIEDPEAEDSDAEPPEAFLVLTTDAPCTLSIDGVPEGSLDPAVTREIGVDSGTIVVKATSSVASEATWTETFELEKGERREASVGMASAIEDFRKLERRERIYPDFDTRLMWSVRDNGVDTTWEAARSHCEALALGAFDDWRLPTIEELDALQSMWSVAAFKTVGEIRLTACCPWSATRIDENHAYNYSFRYRRRFPGHVEHSYDMRALCVRSAHEEISDDPKEIARQRKLQKEMRKERERRKAEKAARKKGVSP